MGVEAKRVHTHQSTQAPPCLVFVSIIWCHCAHTKETWSQHGKTHHMEGKGWYTPEHNVWHPTMAHIPPQSSTNKWIATTHGHHQQHHAHKTQCVHNHPILHHFCVCSTVWCCCVTTHQNHPQAFFTFLEWW